MNMKLVCCCCETRTRGSLALPPRSAVHLWKGCKQDLRLPASEPSGTLGLCSHRGQPPASPQADPVGVEAGCRSFVSQEDTNSQSTPCTCSAGTPTHSTWHYLRFHPIRLSSLGGQVRGLGKEGLGVPARAQQPQPLELHEGQPAAPSPPCAVQTRAWWRNHAAVHRAARPALLPHRRAWCRFGWLTPCLEPGPFLGHKSCRKNLFT